MAKSETEKARRTRLGAHELADIRPDLKEHIEDHVGTMKMATDNPELDKVQGRGYLPPDPGYSKEGSQVTHPWNKNRPRASGGIK